MSKRPIALLQPPQTPNALAFAYMGLPLEKLVLVPMRAETISIALRPSAGLLGPYGGSRRPMHETAERSDVSTEVVG